MKRITIMITIIVMLIGSTGCSQYDEETLQFINDSEEILSILKKANKRGDEFNDEEKEKYWNYDSDYDIEGEFEKSTSYSFFARQTILSIKVAWYTYSITPKKKEISKEIQSTVDYLKSYKEEMK
jgi:hypothetical protein